jgi:hypothetical protein
MMDETSLSYSSSSTSNESSSSLTSTSDDYLSSSTDSVKSSYINNFNEDQNVKFRRCAKRGWRVFLHITLQNDF